MANSIVSPRRRARQPRAALPLQAQTKIQVARIRVGRALALMDAISFCDSHGADVSLSELAVSARNLLGDVLDGLATLAPRAQGESEGTPHA